MYTAGPGVIALDTVRYVSTRSTAPSGATFSEILLSGLAPDGGLYLPERYPSADQATLDRWRDLLANHGYARLAAEILGLFATEYPPEALRQLTDAAYTAEAFGDRRIAPVDRVGDTNLWIAHLSNGPTAAFKDMAMQLIGQLFEYELERRDTWLAVLGATSGDTGSAAEHALVGRERVKVAMLTPRGRMTPFQQAQMFSIDDPAIANLAVEGVFDDCQDLVKAVNLDADFKAKWHIGAVNSINWARVVAQVVYYFAAYFASGQERVSFAVPTGNFGNILAGHVAREMGLPVDRLILATNENNVLHEFFATGVYRPRRADQTVETSSPSMDISKASNFERFVADLLDRDGPQVAHLFGQALVRDGYFDLSGTAAFAAANDRFGFISGTSTHASRLAVIGELWRARQVLVDPHTADAVHVALAADVPGPVIVTETALPAKFAQTIEEATGSPPPVPERFRGLLSAPRHVTPLPNDAEVLKAWLNDWLSAS
ncbi:MAG: threonine synthase [Bifidobacteriaceae bacterium]|jgi:threonine synthase|nr:threonine synthase [Bifidobacteriaceae bacterium]